MSEAKLPDPVGWRYMPSDVWGNQVLTQDPTAAQLAREYGRDVEALFTAAQMHAFRAEGVALERERVAALCKVREKRFLAAFTQTNDAEDQWAAMEFESLAAAIREGDSHE